MDEKDEVYWNEVKYVESLMGKTSKEINDYLTPARISNILEMTGAKGAYSNLDAVINADEKEKIGIILKSLHTYLNGFDDDY